MSNEDLEAKFNDLTQDTLTKEQMHRLTELCWSLESIPDAGVIAKSGALN